MCKSLKEAALAIATCQKMEHVQQSSFSAKISSCEDHNHSGKMNHFEAVGRCSDTQHDDNVAANHTPNPDMEDQEIFEGNHVHHAGAESYGTAGEGQEGLFSNYGFEPFSGASNRHINWVAALLHYWTMQHPTKH